MNFGEDYEEHDKLARLHSGMQQTFSIVARGEAIHWIRKAKKRPGYGSRGSFVSKCVAYYMRNHPLENTKGRVAQLEAEIKFLRKNISGLQQVIRDMGQK